MIFAAIDKSFEVSIPSYEEKELKGKEFISWGESNAFPNYLYGLFTDVTTLRSIINGTADFVCGDNITSIVERLNKEVNAKGDKLYELIGDLARNYLIYGNAFVQVIRSKNGDVAELYNISPKYVRTSKKNDIFYYSEDYAKGYVRASKRIVYPKFVPEARNISSSMIMLKSETDKTYGLPLYIASLKDCEVQKQISEFNLSELENGFYGSYVFNFSNGIPTDEQKEEIEKNVTEKFCGSSNAGRILLNFSDGKDNGVQLQKMEVTNYAEKYNTTDDRSTKKIYESFGASPVIFGVEKDTTGFNSEDYEQAFKLYNRLRVKPLQKKIVAMFDKIYGVENTITIEPFTIDWSEDSKEDNNDVQTIE